MDSLASREWISLSFASNLFVHVISARPAQGWQAGIHHNLRAGTRAAMRVAYKSHDISQYQCCKGKDVVTIQILRIFEKLSIVSHWLYMQSFE